jgi:hypothetical protein
MPSWIETLTDTAVIHIVVHSCALMYGDPCPPHPRVPRTPAEASTSSAAPSVLQCLPKWDGLLEGAVHVHR